MSAHSDYILGRLANYSHKSIFFLQNFTYISVTKYTSSNYLPTYIQQSVITFQDWAITHKMSIYILEVVNMEAE